MPTVPGNVSVPQISKLYRVHKNNILLFRICNKADKALKVQLITAVDNCFIKTLRDQQFGYVNVTALKIITQLFATYRKISNSELKLNEKYDLSMDSARAH